MPSDNYEDHKIRAEETVNWLTSYPEEYQIPIVVVAMPRGSIYLHVLHTDTFTTGKEIFRRPDLKLMDAV